MHYLLSLTIWATLGCGISEAISLWDPTGPYHVGYTQHVFNHTTLNDPTKPGNITLATIYFPTRQVPNATIPYIDPINAKLGETNFGFPNGSLSTVTTTLQFQAPTLLGTSPEFGNGTSPYPTIIFLPGLGGPSVLYTAIQSELTSYGYTVISIDHPGEPPFIQLPNGEGIFATIDLLTQVPPPEIVKAVYDYRVTDVLAMMSDAFLPSLIRTFGAPINTTHFGILGHSIGGAGAAGVMASNETKIASLFKVGVNMDGTFAQYLSATGLDTSVPVVDLKRPFLELSNEGHFNGSEKQPPEGDQTWEYFNGGQSGWRRDFQIQGTIHDDFTDLPLLIERLSGQVGEVRKTQMIGSVLRKFFGYMEGKGLEEVDEYTQKVAEVSVLSKNGEGNSTN